MIQKGFQFSTGEFLRRELSGKDWFSYNALVHLNLKRLLTYILLCTPEVLACFVHVPIREV